MIDFQITEKDHFFMRQALSQARKAYTMGEVPIGAVVVSPEGKILARAYNQIEKKQTQTAHAELLAIAKAGKKYGWRLEGCRIYVTLEPCAMCINAIRLSKLAGVVFGAHSPVFGYQLDKNFDLPLYQLPVTVKEGVQAQEAAHLLQKFFQKKRRKKGE